MRPNIALLVFFCPLLIGCSSIRPSCPLISPDPPTSVRPICSADLGDAAYRPTNLVFQGGGVKGIVYAGALRVLEEEEILPCVKNVAGTSAGAITATLVALGYTAKEIEELLVALDFKKFEDGRAGGIFRIFRRYGFFRGDYFLEWMRCRVGQKTGNAKTTFSELAGGAFLDLQLFTTDLTTGRIQRLSAEETPNLEVALGVRMSMSIPLFFAAVEHSGFGDGDTGENHVFVDGGVVFNYPISAFDTGGDISHDTLGFVLVDRCAAAPDADIDNLLSYTRALVEADLEAQVDDLRFEIPNLTRTAVMDDLGVGTVEFDLKTKEKKALITSGAQCTRQFLERRQALDRTVKQPVKPDFRVCGWVLGDFAPRTCSSKM